MFFSIIIPIHNSEKYLKQCVESILRQSFFDYEVILVNDGSSDRSPQICDDFCAMDNRFRVIHRSKGKGAASARNAGTELATGEYVIYIDSDDYIEKTTFLSDIKEQADNGFDIVCYKFRKYYEDTNEIKECTFAIPKFSTDDTTGKRIMRLVNSDAFYCAPWTKAIRRSVLSENGIRFREGLLSEDQEWYYHVLIGANSITGIDNSYIVYRQHKNSTSVSWSMKNLTDTIGIIRFWKEKIEQANVAADYKEALLNSLAKLYCNLLIGYTRFNNREKRKEYQNLRELSGLMAYHSNPRVNTFYKIYKVGGFGALMLGLMIICKVR